MGLGKILGHVVEAAVGALAESSTDPPHTSQAADQIADLTQKAMPTGASEASRRQYLAMATEWVSVRRMEVGLPPITQLPPGTVQDGMRHPFANALVEGGVKASINFVPPNLVVELEQGERLTASMPPGVASVARAINQGKYPELVTAQKGDKQSLPSGAS